MLVEAEELQTASVQNFLEPTKNRKRSGRAKMRDLENDARCGGGGDRSGGGRLADPIDEQSDWRWAVTKGEPKGKGVKLEGGAGCVGRSRDGETTMVAVDVENDGTRVGKDGSTS